MISGSVDPIDVDIQILLADTVSPEAQSATIAEFAKGILSDAEQENEAALGLKLPHTTEVDGLIGANEESVKPDGTIVYSFSILSDVFGWIADQLQQFAPVKTGRFRSSFEFFIDGVLTDLATVQVKPLSQYVFMSSVPYAIKIEGDQSEPPESRQAPNGVFEAVATLAQQKFGDQFNIGFSYMAPFDIGVSTRQANRTPAITVTLGST